MAPHRHSPIFILVSGPAGAGKSTFSNALHGCFISEDATVAGTRLDACVSSFAKVLKECVTRSQIHVGQPQINWADYAQKNAARPLLVALGKFLRSSNSDVFVAYLWNKFRHSKREVIIVDDWRYLNEHRYLEQQGATVVTVRVLRKNCSPANEEEAASLEEINEVFDSLTIPLEVQEWIGRDECEKAAESVAAYVRSLAEVIFKTSPGSLLPVCAQ